MPMPCKAQHNAPREREEMNRVVLPAEFFNHDVGVWHREIDGFMVMFVDGEEVDRMAIDIDPAIRTINDYEFVIH
jgi:hypothetical protein